MNQHPDITSDSIRIAAIPSVFYNQHEILDAIVKIHCPSGFDADVTYGNGCFYKHMTPPALKFDIDPQVDGVVSASSCHLPVADSSIGSLVFDPPFLTYVKDGRNHKDGATVITKRFGGYWSYDDLVTHYTESIAESYRVLRKKGKMVIKCQDIVHNHRLHCTHSKVIEWGEHFGFRLLDIFVLCAKHRMPSPQKGTQRHARIHHSFFIVLEKP
jgi:hypothetical protein